jgi:Na+:H+ antiporter, NhaA family
MVFRFLKHTFLDPLKEFIHDSRAIGITLLLFTGVSLVLANTHGPIGDGYRHFWEISFDGTTNHHLHLGFLSLPNSLLLIINDLLMAIFFFLAGMEIKSELTSGELSGIKKSLLPVAAAVGGMLVPAVIFSLFNKGTVNLQGWAIPTATDIAFTLGVASLLGKRVPVALKIFLTALAIIDDLGAIIVIALFYGGAIHFMYLVACAVVIGILLLLNHYKVKFGPLHLLLAFVLWYCMFNSGIHATVAGVLFAFMVPTRLLHRFQIGLHVPVYFIIMPVFALANTAILFPENSLQALTGSLSWGILTGLIIGKPLGITLASFFLVKNKWAELPTNTCWYQMIGGGILAGIGFTMSIFISTLAFNTPEQQDIAKISVLLASLLAMLIGCGWLIFQKPSTLPDEEA